MWIWISLNDRLSELQDHNILGCIVFHAIRGWDEIGFCNAFSFQQHDCDIDSSLRDLQWRSGKAFFMFVEVLWMVFLIKWSLSYRSRSIVTDKNKTWWLIICIIPRSKACWNFTCEGPLQVRWHVTCLLLGFIPIIWYDCIRTQSCQTSRRLWYFPEEFWS